MRLLCLLSTIFLSFLTTLPLVAQNVNGAKKVDRDFVLEIPRADLYKVLPPLKAKFKQINGVTFEGYCDSRKLLFLHSTDEAFSSILKVMQEMNLIYFIKENTSIEHAKSACLNIAEIKNSFSIE